MPMSKKARKIALKKQKKRAAAAEKEAKEAKLAELAPAVEAGEMTEEEAAAAAAAAGTAAKEAVMAEPLGASAPKPAAAAAAPVEEAKVEEAAAEEPVVEEFAGASATFAVPNYRRNARDILIENLGINFHGVELLEGATLRLNYGRRYGLIGRNGAGKSTLLNVLGHGDLPLPDTIDIFHVKKEIEASDMTALQAVLSVDEERERLEAEVNALTEELMESDDPPEELHERLEVIYERLEEMDAATAEARAARLLSGLGFTPEMQAQATREFSGGWRMRISLARALFINPMLLLLDEPTNHLDMEAVVWLEDYLAQFKRILLIISHSQDFLNNVCTNIIHWQRRDLIYYSGNYDTFVQVRHEKEEAQMKRYEWEQDQIKSMKRYIARFGHGSAKLAKQAQSKEKTLAKMERAGLTEAVVREKGVSFRFPACGKLPPPVLQFTDVSFRYSKESPWLYRNIDLGIDLDSRVALVGPNGAGKTTLLKLMTNELSPTDGMVRAHHHLRMARYAQHFVDQLDMSQSPLEYMMSQYPDLPREKMRSFIGRYGITSTAQTMPIAHLSDGQKSRVVFAWIAKRTPHMLLLDEPTNHLDIETIDGLADAINAFDGGMVLVSHDMRLISQVATEIWLCQDQTVTPYLGDISMFKMELRKSMGLEGEVAAIGGGGSGGAGDDDEGAAGDD